MEFKTRISSIFIMNMFLVALALVMAMSSLFIANFQYNFFRFNYVLWLIIAFARLMVYRRYIYLILNDKPVLIVNENYIHDLAKGIKYFWSDISAVYENNAYLYIQLYKPATYMNTLGYPVKRFFSEVISNVHKTPFIINLDMIKVNTTVLLEILDDYSIKAL